MSFFYYLNDLTVPVRHGQDTGAVENCLRSNVRASWRKVRSSALWEIESATKKAEIKLLRFHL